MKASPALLFSLAILLGAPFISSAQQPDDTQSAVNTLQASKTFGITVLPGGNSSVPDYPTADMTDKPAGQTPQVFQYDPMRSDPIIAPPPPEALTPPGPKEKTPRRIINPDLTAVKKDDDWLVKGVAAQQKLLEDQEKALTDKKTKNPANDDLSNPNGTKKTPADKTGTNSTTIGNPFYSRYTTSGINALQPSTTLGAVDTIKFDNGKKSNAKLGLPEDTAADIIDAPANGVKVFSPILDAFAASKKALSMPNRSQVPNSRLSVDDWLKSVKDRERQSLQPKQAPTVQDFYAENLIKPKPIDVKPTMPTVTLSRPNAATMKNPLPPNRTIKDPNDF